MIEAKVICDSVSAEGHRLTTFQLRYPKFIHGEFMTHRVISRNASSSRAIPTSRLLEEVRSDSLRAGPVLWGKNQKGMQAAEELSNEPIQGEAGWLPPPKSAAKKLWRSAALEAANTAEAMDRIGVHKQIVNRLLEPFSHINVVATATEWDNFFGLRLHRDAQPEMRALAITMWEARQASEPKELKPGKWHLPFIDEEFGQEFIVAKDGATIPEAANRPMFAIRVSVARCARVSYLSFETQKRSTVEEDLKLFDRLVGAQPLHASPAEHQATPDERGVGRITDQTGEWCNKREHGNFVGWRQFRKMIPGEACALLPEEFALHVPAE
jgi:thymidylate synthase ThyX